MRRGSRSGSVLEGVEYKGYKISYVETTNDWQVSQGGEKVKQVVSLAKGKEWIDRQEKKEFERISCYYDGGYRSSNRDRMEKAEITSFVEQERWGHGVTCWITSGDKKDRYKVSSSQLYASTTKNQLLINEIHAIRDQKKMLNDKEDALVKQLEKVSVPADLKEVE